MLERSSRSHSANLHRWWNGRHASPRSWCHHRHASSSLALCTKYGGMPERLKGADCKSVGLAPTLVQIQLPPPRQKNPEDNGDWQASPHPSLRVLLPFPPQTRLCHLCPAGMRVLRWAQRRVLTDRAVLLLQLRPTALGSQLFFCRLGFFFIKS